MKAYNSNYTDSTTLVTWNDEILDPDKFYVTNGLINNHLFNTTHQSIQHHASPSVGRLNNQPRTITLLKPLYVSPERQTYQINGTKWTVQRGKQHVKVEHPTPLGYTEMVIMTTTQDEQSPLPCRHIHANRLLCECLQHY